MRNDIGEVRDIVREIAAGRMIVLVDDEDRENEGDLLIAAEFADAAAINFMATEGRGLICLALTAGQCDRLKLPPMSPANSSAFGTNFTVSIEAARDVTTGISARDRARTVAAAANPAATADDIITPGHIFPLRADPGGVLVRAGHTEAGCDLSRLAGLFPAAVICEIMNEDGTMARLDDLQKFAARHRLKIGSIKSVIEYRLHNEALIRRESSARARTVAGEFQLFSYRDSVAGHLHLAFCRGEISAETPALVRVLVGPTFLDGVLADLPERSWSVWESLRRIAEAECGALVLLGADDVAAEKIGAQLRSLSRGRGASAGAAGRLRTYGIGAQILRDLGAGKIRLLSSRLQIPSLDAFGLEITEVIEQ
ncbi:MAG: 3,4-dihydroxy-2-butanone-4-phosphate synthase [Gammaproteobacteria bacterium]